MGMAARDCCERSVCRDGDIFLSTGVMIVGMREAYPMDIALLITLNDTNIHSSDVKTSIDKILFD